MDKDAVISRHVVFDSRKDGAARLLGGDPVRSLEEYAFQKHRNGEYSLSVQIDGAQKSVRLPRTFFAFGWTSFLAALETEYPPGEYGYSAAELRPMDELKKFLGLDVFDVHDPDPSAVIREPEEPYVPKLVFDPGELEGLTDETPAAGGASCEIRRPEGAGGVPEAPAASEPVAPRTEPDENGFLYEKNRIHMDDAAGKSIAEISFFETKRGVFTIYRTVVDKSLQGRGIAGQLVQAAVDEIRRRGGKVEATCSYAVKWLKEHAAE